MDLYTSVAYQINEHITKRYSTSFSMSSALFSPERRRHIYAIYGLVRIADEIVDTYQGEQQTELLGELLKDTQRALSIGYSANPVVHAFSETARSYSIEEKLVIAFFDSMRMDIGKPKKYSFKMYQQYIYGSAEVVGLMCLAVFVDGDKARYRELAPAAQALGSAYQKVNFLRDIAADYALGRWYFPHDSFDTFTDEVRDRIINDIEEEFITAKEGLQGLPSDAKKAVSLSVLYYEELLDRIRATPAETLKIQRIRLPNARKVILLGKVTLKGGL